MNVYNRIKSSGIIWGNFLRCIEIGFISFLIRYFYVNYYLLGEENIIVLKGTMSQLYFGGVPIDYGFDMFVLAFHMMIFVLESIVLPSEVYNGVMENLDILISRCSKKSKLFAKFVGVILQMDIIVALLNYSLFCICTKSSPCIQDVAVLGMLLISIVSYQMLYFAIGFISKSEFSYLWTFLMHFIPITFIGFSYANGKELWNCGRFFVLHCCIYNWYNALEINYPLYELVWKMPCFTLEFSYIIGIMVCTLLVYVAKKCFDKIQIL